MKKAIMLLTVIVLVLSTALSSCGKNASDEASDEYTRVKLTKENYDDYIAVNITYHDHIIMPTYSSSSGDESYNMYCTGTITTSPRGDYKFDKVSVTFCETISGFTGGLYTRPHAELDYNGNSACSVTLHGTSSEKLFADFPSSKEGYVKVINISGYVLVPVGK